MPEAGFAQTPLFQLNLLIWLSWPSRPVLEPVFHANGFALFRLGQTVAVPLTARLGARGADPSRAIGEAVSPDLLLRHRERPALITLECKVHSFGPASSAAGQATGLLACTGPHIASTLGLEPPHGWRAFPLYAVSHPEQAAMATTLATLAGELARAGVTIAPDPATALGIDVTADGVYLRFAAPARLPFPMADDVKVLDLAPGEDPRPLYVIPIDPAVDLTDDYGRRALEQRLRAAFVATVGARIGRGPVRVGWDELMTAAIPVWPLWRGRGRRLLQGCRAYVRGRLRDLAALGATWDASPAGFTIADVPPELADRIRRALQTPAHTQPPVRMDQPDQLTIDDALEGDGR
jgi:hypothetical protein